MNTCDKCSFLNDNDECKKGSDYTPCSMMHDPTQFGCIYFQCKEPALEQMISEIVDGVMMDINNELETLVEASIRETLKNISHDM